jgi:hypothetical protein
MYIYQRTKRIRNSQVHPSKLELELELLIYPVHRPGGSFVPLVSKKEEEEGRTGQHWSVSTRALNVQ